MDLSSVEQFTHILLLDPETLAPIDQRVVSCTKNSTQKSLALDTGDRSVVDQASLLECDYGERIILKFMTQPGQVPCQFVLGRSKLVVL